MTAATAGFPQELAVSGRASRPRRRPAARPPAFARLAPEATPLDDIPGRLVTLAEAPQLDFMPRRRGRTLQRTQLVRSALGAPRRQAADRDDGGHPVHDRGLVEGVHFRLLERRGYREAGHPPGRGQRPRRRGVGARSAWRAVIPPREQPTRKLARFACQTQPHHQARNATSHPQRITL